MQHKLVKDEGGKIKIVRKGGKEKYKDKKKGKPM